MNSECNSTSAELHLSLQRWYLGDCSGTVKAPVGPQSVHTANGALHRKDHGAGQKLRPPDHRQTDLYTVRTAPVHTVNMWKMSELSV